MVPKRGKILYLIAAVVTFAVTSRSESDSNIEIEEKFSLVLGPHKTRCLSVGAPAHEVEQYLEELPNLDSVSVTWTRDKNSKFSYQITFDGDQLSSGNQPEISIDRSACRANRGGIRKEVQQVTTSSTDGTQEVQTIRTSADVEGISGYFTVSFLGETSRPIAHNAPAEGENSVAMILKRLSTIGKISVRRDLSKTPVSNEVFNVTSGDDVVYTIGSTDLTNIISVGDIVFILEEVHTVTDVGINFFKLSYTYAGPSTDKESGTVVYRWAYGFEWFVTFLSNVGDLEEMIPSGGENWSGSNPTINVRTHRDGSLPIGGTFRLGYEGDTTPQLDFDMDSSQLKSALENLSTIGNVEVTRFINNNGFNYFVTFLTEVGDLPLMMMDDSHLTGPNAKARVTKVLKGKEPLLYGEATISPSDHSYHITGLKMGFPYFVRLRAKNSEGLGGYSMALPSPLSPKQAPDPPSNVQLIVINDKKLKVVWSKPVSDGGSPVNRFLVEWDYDHLFTNALNTGMQQEIINDSSETNFCFDIVVEFSSLVYARVLAYNGYSWSTPGLPIPGYINPTLRAPGPVLNLNAVPTGSVGIRVTWIPPSIDNCVYGGDGGSPITHYVLEWDKRKDFSTPAESITLNETLGDGVPESFRIPEIQIIEFI